MRSALSTNEGSISRVKVQKGDASRVTLIPRIYLAACRAQQDSLNRRVQACGIYVIVGVATSVGQTGEIPS